jgi:hypothetical protein
MLAEIHFGGAEVRNDEELCGSNDKSDCVLQNEANQ